MAKKNNIGALGLSYYRLSLLSYLKDADPEQSSDFTFIKQRADAAAKIYSDAIKSGSTHTQAEEVASEELYRDLHFSPYNTLVKVLWEEFSEVVPEEQAREIALKLLPLLTEVLTNYTLTDELIDTPDYEKLYTELTGAIQILLDNGKL